jgi:hypothetical protein
MALSTTNFFTAHKANNTCVARTLLVIHYKKSVLKIQEYIHEGANLKFYIPEFFNFKLLIPEYSSI